ncbi:MAG: release factor glutamine [Beijerinckiaceae bacterium]|nr:MAG: release factor glutamine [Beijerinckiaceae bacterium]
MSAPGDPANLSPGLTLRAAVDLLANRLVAADIDEPRREARLLVMTALGIDLATLMRGEQILLGPAVERLAALLLRREAHEPLSRIIGRREFFGLDFELNAATLDPRPDTETLVEAVLADVDAGVRRGAPLALLDIGTGTGAILLALLANLPAARGVGVDLAPEAVAMAAGNAERLGLSARAAFRQGDLLAGIDGAFDIIVSNPPYIASAEITTLEPEVRLHDPHLALDGGPDGLSFYRRLIADAPSRLAPEGFLALEVGFGQAETVDGMMEAAGFRTVGMRRDLGGILRVVFGRAPAGDKSGRSKG